MVKHNRGIRVVQPGHFHRLASESPRPVTATSAPKLPLNAFWSILGASAYALSQWAVVALLAKLGTASMVGVFALGLAITAPVFLLANFRLRAVAATDASCTYRISDYAGLRLAASAIALLAVAGIAFTQSDRSGAVVVILWLGVAKFIESASDLIYGLLQRAERLDIIAISLVLRGAASVTAVGLLLLATRDVVWASAGLAGAWLLVLLIYDLPQAIAVHGGFSGSVAGIFPLSQTRGLLWLTLPLGLSAALASLTVNVPRYFIEAHLGPGELGIFVALGYVGVAMSTLVNAVADSGAAKLGRDASAGRPGEFAATIGGLLGMGTAVGVAGIAVSWLLGAELLSLLYTPDYALRAPLFVILMIAALATNLASVLSLALVALREFRVNLFILGFTTIAIVALSAWLVPRRGLEGAAWSLTGGMSAMVVLSGVAVVSEIRRMNPGGAT